MSPDFSAILIYINNWQKYFLLACALFYVSEQSAAHIQQKVPFVFNMASHKSSLPIASALSFKDVVMLAAQCVAGGIAFYWFHVFYQKVFPRKTCAFPIASLACPLMLPTLPVELEVAEDLHCARFRRQIFLKATKLKEAEDDFMNELSGKDWFQIKKLTGGLVDQSTLWPDFHKDLAAWRESNNERFKALQGTGAYCGNAQDYYRDVQSVVSSWNKDIVSYRMKVAQKEQAAYELLEQTKSVIWVLGLLKLKIRNLQTLLENPYS